MTPFILAAFWAAVPGIPGGFILPKVVVILVGMLMAALWNNKRGLLLLGVMIISTIGSINREDSLMGVAGFWANGVLPVTVYLLLMGLPTQKPWLKWAGVGLSLHALWQVAFEVGLPQGRAVAWIGSPVDLGAILALAAPASGPFLPIVLAGVWVCGSRGAALAILFAFASNRVRWMLLPILLLPFIYTGRKEVARQEMMRMAWQGFIEKPWLGHGPNTFREIFNKKRTQRLVDAVGESYRQQHAHNDILEALCSTGILGLLAYLLLLWPLRRNQSLVALFIVMKYNPVGFEVLCAGALVAANELYKKMPPRVFKPSAAISLVPAGASLPYPPEQA